MALFNRAAEKPTAASTAPHVIDTEGAREDLRMAKHYVEKYKEGMEKFRGGIAQATLDAFTDPASFEAAANRDQMEQVDYRGLALRYINSSRTKDPAATLLLKLEGKDLGAITADMLEADIYRQYALAIVPLRQVKDDMDRENLRQAIQEYEQAIALHALPSDYRSLAYAYIRADNRPQALERLKTALEIYPGNLDLREASDDIESKPTWGVPSTKDNSGLLILVMGVVMVGILFFIIMHYAAK